MNIPRFMICQGSAQDAVDSVAYFVAIDIPVGGSDQRRGMLMYSSAEAARGFITNTPGEWHVRCLDAYLLSEFFKDSRNRMQFDCVAVDYFNGKRQQFVQCIDAVAVEAALAAWNGEQGEMPTCESWNVFI